MKCAEIGNPDSPQPVRRRSLRIAMEKDVALHTGGQAVSAEDELDEVPLIKRMEKVQEVQRLDRGGLLDGRINTYCNVNEVARQIRAKLNQEELDRFRTSAFGVLLDVLDCPWISGQLLIHLVGNCVRSTDESGRKDKLKFRILGNELHVKDVEPTGDELLLDNVKELFKDKPTTAVKARKKLSLSLSKRVRKVKERQVNIRDAFVRLKTEGKASGSGLKSAVKRGGTGSVKEEHGAVERERKGKKVCVANTDSEQLDMMKEIKEIKENQDAQAKKLDEILGILRQKTASVEAGSASGKGSLMGGNEEPRVRNEGLTVEGNTDAECKCGVDLDLSCEDGGPSFDLLTPLPRVDAVGAEIQNDKSGNVLVTEACDRVKEGKCPDIPYTETQYDPRFLDLIDRQKEMILMSLQNASSVPLVSCEGIIGQDAIQGGCKTSVSGDDTAKKSGNTTMPDDVHVPVEVESTFGGSSGSNKGKLGQHIDGGKRRRSLDDDDFERIFTSSRVGSGGQGVNGAQDALLVFSMASDSNTECVEIERPKRVHKNPERYTPTEVEHDKKKRKLGRLERAKQHLNHDSSVVCHGPFSEDPKAMPTNGEIEKVFSMASDSNTECVEIERPKRVHKNPERYTPTEVEHDKKKRKLGRLERAKQHLNHDSSVVCHGPFSEDPKAMPTNGEIEKYVEIAMHFLEVKGRQYNLLQMYTTATPYFLQGLYNHQAMVNVGKAKKEEVVTNRNLSSEVLGLARAYSRPWSECDFVYMPLNTGDHWMLLVLEVEGRTIRVYDSKGRKGKSCRALNEYMQCITELLPVLLDLLSVYDEHSEGPMGKKKFNIEVVDGCTQQDDGCNCGMFMLKFAEYLMMDRKISDVHARDMEGYRVKMTTELMRLKSLRSTGMAHFCNVPIAAYLFWIVDAMAVLLSTLWLWGFPTLADLCCHVEIAMHFLEVKGRQYNLLQMYTTATPYFLQGLYNHQAMVNVGKAKKEEVVTNRNLSSEVLGLARAYSRPWSECDFVYMPLNTSDHWMLLVLEVEGRTIRVYDSKGRKGKSCRALNEYMQCITELLLVLLDLLSVYDEHSEGPMGKKKFNIEVVDGCPQQDDGCNCGMFMLKFAEYLMMDRKISDVHARDMEGYRVKMTTELIVYSNELKEKAEDK
ncbi:unnamed protein product [Cuscuta campestris]|uniref:Ubiquitin-like protease family profile domain-containing protein n=1 Tax=Cuscuta campestris TaxID=132261 RepID=A0A484LES5_9ASTE|nr:unnamed protein product [Cuscuta campestris]